MVFKGTKRRTIQNERGIIRPPDPSSTNPDPELVEMRQKYQTKDRTICKKEGRFARKRKNKLENLGKRYLKIKQEAPVLFRTACPCCNKREGALVKHTRKGGLFLFCPTCQAQLNGTQAVLRVVKRHYPYGIVEDHMEMHDIRKMIDEGLR